jgi:hypothetical protein
VARLALAAGERLTTFTKIIQSGFARRCRVPSQQALGKSSGVARPGADDTTLKPHCGKEYPMKMFRNLLLAAVAVTGLFLPVTGSSSQAKAHAGHAHYRYYYLYYRASVYSPWYYYGATYDYNQAVAYANWIQSLGYQVYVY